MLQDRLQRTIGYLRLSVTRACSMKCLYCRPALLADADPHQMAPAEIQRLVTHLAHHHGLKKVRITGGEPTARPDLPDIIARIARIDAITDLAMTTNGLTLPHRAKLYADAGLQRVNISLDSLDPRRFARITGVDGLPRLLEALDAAQAAGLGPIKLNTVVVAGHNDHELPDLLRFAGRRGLDIRFIELMPMGPLADAWAQRFISEGDMRRRLDAIVTDWQPLPQGPDSARRYRVTLDDGTRAVVGFITAMSCNFCASCNRIRIASDGKLYPCLMDEPRGSIMPALRPTFDAHLLDRLIADGLAHKAPEHPQMGVGIMTHIGG